VFIEDISRAGVFRLWAHDKAICHSAHRELLALCDGYRGEDSEEDSSKAWVTLIGAFLRQVRMRVPRKYSYLSDKRRKIHRVIAGIPAKSMGPVNVTTLPRSHVSDGLIDRRSHCSRISILQAATPFQSQRTHPFAG